MALVTGKEGQRIRLLVVDDEPMNLELLERSLRHRYEVFSARSGERALEIMRAEEDLAIILSDYRMPGMNGAALLAQSATVHPWAKRVVITGYADADSLISAVNDGHVHYLIKKPWNHQELHQVLEHLVGTYQLEVENRALLSQLRLANEELHAKERVLSHNLDEQSRDLISTNRELERINRELEVFSYKDNLTGLYNHRAFQERLDEELARARRYGQPLTLLYGDIDHFAALNRDLGYQLGDEILRTVAAVMSDVESGARVRASDIVARYSGEEFVVLLPETGKLGAVTKADRLREAVVRARFPGERDITMSFGVASFPEDATEATELVRCAEAAQRAAKRAGRNQVHLYSGGGYTPALAADGSSLAESTGIEADDSGEESRFPNYYERLRQIVAMLRRDRAASCLFVDLGQMRRIERDHGLAQHTEFYAQAGAILAGMRGHQLRESDLVCRTEDDDAFLCILSPARTLGGGEHVGLERIADRVREALFNALGPTVRDLMHQEPQISVGHSRVLNNSMIRPERLIARLVSEARESATLNAARAAQRNKAHLQEIILGGQLNPVYQPIVHMRSGDVFGFEALTRGPRKTALESPGALFAIAADVGLTFELDRACFRTALRGAIGLEPVHRLFVNLLPLSFYDSYFIETEVGNLLDAAGLLPANVVFEITEQLAIENFTSFRTALARYTAMGFGVAIDDVGTKHSNLEAIMALRPQFIKISDVLTRGVARSTVKREMLASLARIASAIDAVVVAEGIETPDDLAILRELGLRYGQGFFLARPGPAFPRVRPAVRRAIEALSGPPRGPIPVPPADPKDVNYLAAVDRGAELQRTATPMARGSGEYTLRGDAGHDDWSPLLGGGAGAEAGEDATIPLIESLRRPTNESDDPVEGSSGGGTVLT